MLGPVKAMKGRDHNPQSERVAVQGACGRCGAGSVPQEGRCAAGGLQGIEGGHGGKTRSRAHQIPPDIFVPEVQEDQELRIAY